MRLFLLGQCVVGRLRLSLQNWALPGQNGPVSATEIYPINIHNKDQQKINSLGWVRPTLGSGFSECGFQPLPRSLLNNFEIRSTKFETNSKFKYQMFKTS
jgi:hypothetical protein